MDQIRGGSAWPIGSVVLASVHPLVYGDSSYDLPILLTPGKRFIVFPVEQDREHGSLSMQRCDLIEDSPANRQDVFKGFALHDDLRGPDIQGHWFPDE
ncbi:hypothetical protein [Occallatibacter savannae]|uniref:hypothetical protein n=1 Tax=Occallatibacter savannae TaxID=1002691 RepID=UPI0013A59988|nr:hypothetical protein [Occallatibacter savannae]